MSKKTIAIVSVLKPVTDSRNYGKIGLSIGQTNKYAVNIIGFSAKNADKIKNITFQPVGRFARLQPARLLAPWKIYKKIVKLKPELIIVNTHELLLVMCLYKILFGTKLLYDVQENYYRNIRYTDTFPPLIRILLALYVRGKEKLCAPFVDHFLLAEKSYARDLKFTAGRATIVENKTTLEPLKEKPKSKKPGALFAYTGTIAKNYGIFDAIDFIDRMHRINAEVKLLIAGYCAKKTTWKRVIRLTENKNYVSIEGGISPFPHDRIVEIIKTADFLLLPYHLDRSIIRCIPTKIYEAIALRTPMIIRPNPLWLKLCSRFNACMPCKFEDEDENFLKLILNRQYYTKGDPEEICWRSEETRLLSVIETLLPPEK